MKILVILFIIIISFIVGYQTRNDVLKDETLNTIKDNMKVTYIKLEDMSDVLYYLYDNQDISKNSDKHESQNEKRNKPVNTITTKIQVPQEQYSREFNKMYCEKVRKMLLDQLVDKIKVETIFDTQSGYYNIYAFLNLNNFTSK